jgi:uncharacterized SAM-binding protein YcdF (DUF218 family)
VSTEPGRTLDRASRLRQTSPRTGVLSRVSGLAAVAGFFTLAFTPLPNALHRRLTNPRIVGKAQAIVVLGAGSNGSFLADASLRRTLEGVRLYRSGQAPALVLLGPRTGRSASEAELRGQLARDLGVPPEAIVLGNGRTTREEAEGCRRLLSPRGVRRILLVTGSHHMPRARAFFMLEGFDVLPASVEEVAASAVRPEERLALARGLLQEALARLAYRLVGVL